MSATPPSSALPKPVDDSEPSCPKCGGRMWDNRISKKNPKAPDWRCRSRSCDGVLWPPKAQGPQTDDRERARVEYRDSASEPEYDGPLPF